MEAGRQPVHSGATTALVFLLICAVTVVAYGRSFTVPFQFDDYPQIVDDHAVRSPSVGRLLHRARARIIPFASLALDYRLHGENPFGYHVFNLLVHLVTSFLLFRLAFTLCRTPRLRHTALAEHPLVLASAAAVGFACHPIQVQAVTYVVQRMTSLAAMFYVGSVLLYVRARADDRRAFYLGALGLAFAAYVSKENSASLPLVLALAEWVFFPGAPVARRARRLLPFFVLVLVIPLCWKLFGPAPSEPTEGAAEHAAELVRTMAHRAQPGAELSPLEYFLTQCTVVPRYLGLVLFPKGLNLDHDVPTARGLSAAVAGGFLLLAALFGAGLYAARRSPLVGFGVLWVFLALSVESSVFPIADVMVEHRMYLAMPGIALVAGCGFVSLYRRRARLAVGVGVALALLLAGATIARNEVWRTQLSLWRDALAKSPGKARVQVNLGMVLHLEGKLDEAIAHYCRALEIAPTDKLARSNLNIALDAQHERQLEREGDAISLTVSRGTDGVVILAPPDPCRRD